MKLDSVISAVKFIDNFENVQVIMKFARVSIRGVTVSYLNQKNKINLINDRNIPFNISTSTFVTRVRYSSVINHVRASDVLPARGKDA